MSNSNRRDRASESNGCRSVPRGQRLARPADRARRASCTLCAYRPPFHLFPADGAVPRYREIELEVLSAPQEEDLTATLLQGGEVPAELLTFVRQRAGGNPFFVEEPLNALIQTETLQRSKGAWKTTVIDERFNGTLRDALLDRAAFHTLAEARVLIER